MDNFVLLLFTVLGASASFERKDHPSIARLKEYLRISDAVHPNPVYESSISWITQQAVEIGLDPHRIDFEPLDPKSFAVWFTWNGTNPSLPSILINTHIDVVAVDPDKWTHGPFEAYTEENGDIYARGAIDMKSATAAVLEALRRLKDDGFVPFRTIHLTAMPDEEVGGHLGMDKFVNSSAFCELNVGLDIDECEINAGNELLISYAEKPIWQFNVTAKGNAGHASTLPRLNQTAYGQLLNAINAFMQFREEQLQLVDGINVNVSDVTSLNLARTGGGIGNNIIPDEVWASFDMRIRLKPNWTFTDVEAFLNRTVSNAGPNVTYTFIQKSMHAGESPINDGNIWWTMIMDTCQQLQLPCRGQILSGATDGRYVRSKGIPVYGIHPFLNTEKLQHANDERINGFEFLAGIDRYYAFIKNLASLSSNPMGMGGNKKV